MVWEQKTLRLFRQGVYSKEYDLNLRLSLNMTSVYNYMSKEVKDELFACNLG